MGLFSKKPRASSTTATSSTAASVASFIGRKFSSGLSVDECLSNFAAAAAECYPTVGGIRDLPWAPPPDVPGFVSTQGGAAGVPPTRFVALDMADGSFLALAVWNRKVGYGGEGTGGRREMWFVPPNFDGSPIPLPGVWKRLDQSLSSTGNVEAPFWGA